MAVIPPNNQVPLPGSLGPTTLSGEVIEDQGLGKEFEDPSTRDNILGNLGISAPGYIKVVQEKTERINKKSNESEEAMLALIDGSAVEKAEADIEALREKASDLVDQISQSFIPNVDRDFITSELESEYLAKRNISDAELAKRINPATQQPYTRQEWNTGIDKWKGQEAERRGATVDENVAIGAAFAQVLGLLTGQDNIVIGAATVAEEERVRRLEMQKSASVRKLQAKNAGLNAQLKLVTTQLQGSMGLYRDRVQSQQRAIEATWENDKANERLKTQIDNGDFQLATREAGDILGNLRLLPSEQVKNAVSRYNTLASYANEKGGQVVLEVISKDEAQELEREASFREVSQIRADFNDFVYKFRNNWEEVTEADKVAMQSALNAEGPKWMKNAQGEWEQRTLTLDDVAVVAEGFNRLKPTTQLSQDRLDELKRQFNKKIEVTQLENDLDRLNRINVANIRKASAIAVAKERSRAATTKLFQGQALTSLELDGLKSAYKDTAGNISDLDSSLQEWVNHVNSDTYTSVINEATGKPYTRDQAVDVIFAITSTRNAAASEARGLYNDDYNVILEAQFDLQTEAMRESFAGDPELEALLQQRIDKGFQRQGLVSERANPITIIVSKDGKTLEIKTKESEIPPFNPTDATIEIE